MSKSSRDCGTGNPDDDGRRISKLVAMEAPSSASQVLAAFATVDSPTFAYRPVGVTVDLQKPAQRFSPSGHCHSLPWRHIMCRPHLLRETQNNVWQILRASRKRLVLSPPRLSNDSRERQQNDSRHCELQHQRCLLPCCCNNSLCFALMPSKGPAQTIVAERNFMNFGSLVASPMPKPVPGKPDRS